MKNKCTYVFKKGPKKGSVCNIINCLQHGNTGNTSNFSKDREEKVNIILDVVTKRLKKEEDIKTKILNLDTSIDNKVVIVKYYQNLKKLDFNTTEYYKNQIFIDNCLSIPWNKYYKIKDNMKNLYVKEFIEKIKSEFDKEIHGMENVKNEIINYVCKFITNPQSCQNNIALYGCAGVCKTKFITVLSKVLNLPLKIISLGGIRDSSFLLGHHYTYVEATYGSIIQSIVQTKIMNPIIYFDELDKISLTDAGSDIHSVLSNLTDNTLNYRFSDHYFRGINFDLSKIMYVFTFNDISKINKVLLDRLNIIYVENPKDSDKIIILDKHVLPEIKSNITKEKNTLYNLTFDKDCYNVLINYVNNIIDKKMSSGIRECSRILEKILLEINKEILLKTFKLTSTTSTNIDKNTFESYFNKLKSQFLFNSDNDNNFLCMYS